MSEKPATFAAIAKTLQESVGKTYAEMTLDLMRHFEPDDPERLFWQWLVNNRERLPEACQELGVEPLDKGKGYVLRLKEVVKPKLAAIYNRGEV